MAYATTLEKSRATQIAITVRVPYAELELLLPKSAEAISSETEIEGFRKGHAPYEVVKQKVGEFKILEEAARKYIAEHFEKLMAEVEEKEFKGKSFGPVRGPRQGRGSPDVTSGLASNGVEPVGEPQVAITKLAPGEEFEFKITLSLLPPIELPDYNAIATRVRATKTAPTVTEQEVADALERLRESRAKLVTVNRGAKLGDRVEVDFITRSGGVTIEGGESRNHPFILGQGRFIPGFEEALVGMKAGEEKTFTLAVPQDWRDRRIAGQALEFKTAMKLVQEREVPAGDEEFAKSLGNFSSAAEVKTSLRTSLAMEKETKERERLRIDTLEAIAAETTAEIPDVLIAHESEKMLAELKESIAGAGLKFDQYLGHIKKTEADLVREWRPGAERRVKFALILREIARREAIQPSEEEIQQTVNRTLAHRGRSEMEAKILDPQVFLDYNRGIARNEKVFQFLESLTN